MVAEEVEKLLNAAKNGDLTVLNSVKVTDVIEDDHGANCIHYAARGGSLEALQYLVESKSLDPNKRNSVGATPLHDAAATGNLEALKWLLNRADTKVDDQDGSGATVTHLSARYGHTQTLTWLLDETNCDILKKSASGALPIHSAAEGGHLECVKLLVEEAPRSVNMQMNNGATPVYLACQSGHLDVAQYLSQKNGTPKIHTFDGMSSLHAAAQMNQLPIVKWLIKDQGLNPNERDFDGATPLHYAASQGHKDIVQWLMKEGGARIILDNLGGSPLHNAAELNQNQVVNDIITRIILTLLENGCNPEITDNEGLTAEELAVKCGNTTAAAILRGEITSLPASPPASSTQVGATSTLPSAPVQQVPPLTPVLLPSPTPPPPPPPLVPSSVQTPSEQSKKAAASITASHSRAAVTTVLADHPSFVGSAEGDSANRSYSLISVVAEVHKTSQGASQGHLCSSRETGEQEYVYESECPQNCAHTHSPVAAVKSTPTASNLSSDHHHFPTDSSAAFDISSVATRSKTLASTKNWQTAAQGASDMASKPSEETNGMSSGEESKEPAKSVIKITSNNVTIISTGREGRMASKIVTMPLRKNSDEYLGSGAMVTARKKDSEFISALTQKLHGSGSSSRSSPINSPGSTLNRMSSNLSRSSSATTPAWQHQQKQVEEALLKRQQIPEKTSDPVLPPPPLVNGHANNSNETLVNGGLEEDLSPHPPPPPPPPPPGPESNSSSSRKTVIADASYSSSRPKLLDSYSSVPNGSQSPTSPGRISFTPHQQKHDLMAALHAAVTSGAPSSLLRKTKGPPTGGVMEVFSSKRTSVRTSTTRPESSTEPKAPISSGPEKQNSPIPPVEGFDPKNFLDQVPKVNSSGNQIPEWKRLMVAKTVAQKAEEEYLEKKKVEEYEARFKNMPAWKRALLEKKEGSSK